MYDAFDILWILWSWNIIWINFFKLFVFLGTYTVGKDDEDKKTTDKARYYVYCILYLATNMLFIRL